MLPGQVARAGLAAVVVEVLEAERLALGDVEQRARLHRVGLQAVGLDAQLEAERVRPRLQRLEVVLVVEVGEDEVDVAPHAAVGVGVVVEDRLLVLLDDQRQVREQAVADAAARRRPRSSGVQIVASVSISSESSKNAPPASLSRRADRRREQVRVPEVGDRARAGLAEVVDDVGVGRRVVAALRLLAGAALPVGDQQPVAASGARPVDVLAVGWEVDERGLVERVRGAGGLPAVVIFGRLDVQRACLLRVTPACGRDDRRRRRAAERRAAGDRRAAVGELLDRGGAVGRDDGTADGQLGPAVRSIVIPRAFARSSAACIASHPRLACPSRGPRGRGRWRCEWCTSAISAPPKPASAIWSISLAISALSTSAFGHHQRNFGCTSRSGDAKSVAKSAAAPGRRSPATDPAPTTPVCAQLSPLR